MPIFAKAQNFVNFLQFHNCARPWFVYAETFAPAFLKLFLTITIPDLNDIARNMGYHQVSGGGGPGGRGPKRFGRSTLSNINNQVENFSQGGLRHLLMVTEPLEKIGFIWLLWSATDQFFMDWQTGLMKSVFCEDVGLAGPYNATRAPGGRVGVLPAGAVTPLPIVEQNRANWARTSIAVSLPFGSYSAVFSATIVGPFGGIEGCGAQLRLAGNVGPSVVAGDPVSIAQGQAGTVMVKSDFFIPLGGSCGWEIYGPAVPVGVVCNAARVVVWANA